MMDGGLAECVHRANISSELVDILFLHKLIILDYVTRNFCYGHEPNGLNFHRCDFHSLFNLFCAIISLFLRRRSRP